jgi:transposase
VHRRPLAHADGLDLRLAEYDRIIAKAARDDARSRRLMERPGIGPIGASALLASIGGGHDFKNNRQVAAWMGLTPVQLYARYHLVLLCQIVFQSDAESMVACFL